MRIDNYGYPIPETIPELLILTFAKKENRRIAFFLGVLEMNTVTQVRTITGIGLTGYEIMIDNYSIIHVFTRHSDPVIELAKGNEPILFNDFESVQTILNQPDTITYIGKTKQGINAILFEKEFTDTMERFYCIHEVRTKRKRLCLKTKYKKKVT